MVQFKSLLITASLAALLALPLGGVADTPLPQLPPAKEKANPETLCVEPVEDMRKNHMEYILHQRDDTMRRGIRTSKHSLKECIDCHNPPGADGKVLSVKSRDHFCSSCHHYAAVKIDCFTCHTDKPAGTTYRSPSVKSNELRQLLNVEQARVQTQATTLPASTSQGDAQ